ncbi:citrate lyase acyl carrier protein|uniref:Citrate lyase subunit gamma (Acyl carrier protein) n=1 Tax=Dendrosporobacter quercicolus TaxID=146817 RepID=A0A1G9WB89_9FIRM|nr:citrate lyase acyl carrier protein [Dendrosporobacter quercicolus]NSL47663.1 citrate lyase acyl carrier protein [Dendrosporobacter quercicolus DSM 1736]SDM81762.1 citrate lyase subunit gamma (acyl carrier protein) [Dendrosporobacter quercicolus]
MSETKRLRHAATAGFEEKNDLLVRAVPANQGAGIQISITSPVLLQFGDHIRDLVAETVKTAGFDDIIVEIKDKGAWDYTIQARLLAALERGMKDE